MPNILSPPSGVLSGTKPALPQPVRPLQKEEPEKREFGDALATRRLIYNNVLASTQTLEPISNQRHTLQLRDVKYADDPKFSYKQQKEAILGGKSLNRRLQGTWELSDNETGEVLDSRPGVVARVPHLTDRGTFIHNGNEYTLSNQMRLRPGVFTRVKDNGEIEAHANLLPGKGVSHRYFLDPEKGIFHMRMGQAKIPLMPLLKSLGATDKQLQEAWGNELWQANAQKDNPGTLSKLYQKLVRKIDPDADEPAKRLAVAEVMEKMELDPEVTQRTLGNSFNRMGLDAILATTNKLLAVSRGEQEVDDRDHLAYQNVLGPEDLFAERIAKDYGGLRRQLLHRSSFKGDLSAAQSGMLSRQLEAALLHSGLGQSLEEITPADIFDKQSRISRLGEGGIPSIDAVPDAARAVQPRHLAFMDPVRTPESFKVGVDVHIANTARKGSDGRIYSPFVDPRSGKEVWKSPQDLADLTVAFPGEMRRETKRVGAMQGGKLKFVPKQSVDLVVPTFENAFSPLGNMVPMKSAVKAQRMAMASRMLTQALPLENAESPLVQTGISGEEDTSYEQRYGRKMGAVFADKPGRVVSISDQGIKVKYDDGTTEEKQLYNNFPYNRKSVTGDTRIVIRRKNGELWTGSIDKYHWEDSDQVQSVDPDSKQSAWKRVTGYITHCNDKQLLRITTKSGRSVVVTEDHSLITLDKHGELVPVYPKDCEIGLTRLPVAMLQGHRSRRHGQEISKDPSGILWGLYVAEGHCPPTQPGLVNIAVEPDDRAEQVLEVARQCGYEAYRNGGNVCFTDHAFAAKATEHFGHLSHNKRIPAWVLGTPVWFRESFVQGYMAGDGCLWEDSNGSLQLQAVTVSRELRDGFVELLLSLGIMTTLFDAPRKHLNDNWRDAYGCRIISSHVGRLRKWFYYADRERQLHELLKPTYRAASFDLVPVAAEARKLLYKGYIGTVPSYVYKTANQGAVAKHRLKENTGVFGDWARSDVLWDPIEEIIPVAYEERVYDLCVQHSEAFCVNGGLLVHNTYIHNTPTVKPGDTFGVGQALAKSNFTDAGGTTALGKNARVAYIPFRGQNFEDALVISESFAKRMSSEHMYQHGVDFADDKKTKRRDYVSLFPSKYDKQTLESIDEDGVIKQGTIVSHGDPLILSARQKDVAQHKVHRRKAPGFTDQSEIWKHHAPGVVTDVFKGKKGTTVLVKSLSAMQKGDKLSGRYGDKGVISAIVPDNEMPHSKDGQAFEVLLNPLGIISRTNPAQMVEAALGKIAAKTGKPYKVVDFEDIQDLTDFAIQELKKNQMEDLEDITDPSNERKIPGVFTGNRFFMKLHHTAEGKGQGRGTGGYTMEGTPAKGGETGSKRISLLDNNALLSHGATEVLRDAGAIRGQRNEEFWLPFMRGVTPPKPKVPIVYQKFVNELKASGINVVEDGTQTHIMALTDKDVGELAGQRYLKSGDTVQFEKGLKPITGGLFDPALTGGHNGNRWSAIKLAEPMPNPVMEEPIRRVLGLTQKRFEAVLSGQEELQGHRGPAAFTKALGKMDLDKEIAYAQAEFKSGRKASRDMAIRKLGYLKSAKKLGIHPKDWMLTKAPVLPPMFRPVSVMSDNRLPLVSDANFLYKELLEANDNLTEMSKEVDDVADERLAVYNAFKAVTGLGDPIHPKLQEKRVKGILKHVFGSSPKLGAVQRRLVSSTVDLVGRAVITPNPDLDMDHVGLPENRAWDIYKNFIVRRLKRRGMPLVEAAKQVENRSEVAKQELVKEMGERPVVINRAPVLHRFGIMAFYPRLTKSDTLEVSPLIVKGFGADFDGDAMQYHVPVSDEAKDEAVDRMLPSRNLLSPADFKSPIHVPSQEYTGGLYAASSTKSKRRVRTFRNTKDMLAAYRRGELDINDEVEVME